MRDYSEEYIKRVKFIKEVLSQSEASGIIFGNSGGKDSALVGILCKAACENTIGVIMPCTSRRNFNEDMKDGLEVANKFNIETITVDLTKPKEEFLSKIEGVIKSSVIAASQNRIVAGTGNRSEAYMGYFTKWGDGAHDFNPIADLTVTEIYEFLAFLDAPKCIITKAPSAGLFDGQTDEGEMGITYAQIDQYILNGTGDPQVIEKIEKAHAKSQHKRQMPITYKESK
jgi:NAD+ synthase